MCLWKAILRRFGCATGFGVGWSVSEVKNSLCDHTSDRVREPLRSFKSSNRSFRTVVPLHASIQEQCRKIGFDNLAPIIWYKISNAAYEVENGSSFLGKPYEPNAVIKNDVEYILMQRKPGGYRSPSVHTRVLSVISADNYQKWFQQVWNGVTGASTREHPAPSRASVSFPQIGTSNPRRRGFGLTSAAIGVRLNQINISIADKQLLA
jgi:hypothetical protein